MRHLLKSILVPCTHALLVWGNNLNKETPDTFAWVGQEAAPLCDHTGNRRLTAV